MATVKTTTRKAAIEGALALAGRVGQLPARKLWLDYDEEADVLYISLYRPQAATRTVELDDQGLLLHYRGRKLVGITVLEASSREPAD